VEAECRHVDVADFLRRVHHGQNLPQLAHVLPVDASRVVILEKLSQPFVPEAADYGPAILGSM
jgi:hypothetical protein